jgi:hypothetical protein
MPDRKTKSEKEEEDFHRRVKEAFPDPHPGIATPLKEKGGKRLRRSKRKFAPLPEKFGQRELRKHKKLLNVDEEKKPGGTTTEKIPEPVKRNKGISTLGKRSGMTHDPRTILSPDPLKLRKK